MGALPPDKEARECIVALQNRYGWEFVPSAGGHAHVAGRMRCGFGRGGCQFSVLSTSINAARVIWRIARRCPHGFAPKGRQW